MEAFIHIGLGDIKKNIGKMTVEDFAATLYNAYHGKCECASHPFVYSSNGDFHGYVPWDRMKPEKDDKVVFAFRYAAICARDALMSAGVGYKK